MKYIIGVLLVLFASYADIFLFRIGIIPVQPSSFLIPLFLVVCLVKYPVLDYIDLLKSHSFKIFAAILFFSIIYAAITPVKTDVILKKISLDVITIFFYVFSVHFFRTEKKWLVFLVMLFAFLTLSGSVWYDFFIGLPKYSIKLGEALRKGGFGENPNQAASGIKLLALGVLVFLKNSNLKRNIFISIAVISVFLTFSRSGIISIILLLFFGTLNKWSSKFEITGVQILKSSFKMIFLFSFLYFALLVFAGIIKEYNPSFTRGSAGARIDLLLGKSDTSVVSEDLGTGGRGDFVI